MATKINKTIAQTPAMVKDRGGFYEVAIGCYVKTILDLFTLIKTSHVF